MKITQTLPVQVDKGSGEPLVLPHGLGNNYSSWEFVLKHVDYTKWRVIALDLLGFGDAPKPAKAAYSPRDHAQAVMNTLDKLGVKKATFAGHSMGCIVAIDIGAHWANRVESLVLLGAPLYKNAPKSSPLRKFTKAEGMYFSIFEIVQKNPDAVQAGGTIADELVPFVKGMEITEEVWPAYRKSLEHTIMQQKSYKQAQKLAIPTLFVNGLFDLFIIAKNTKLVRKHNKNVRIKNVLGPHELTPSQGKTVAKIINQQMPARAKRKTASA